MKLLKALLGLSLISLFASCSGLFDSRDSEVSLSFNVNDLSDYEPLFRAASNAGQENSLYVTAYITGDKNNKKPIEKSISFNKLLNNFDFTIKNLTKGSNINILLEIDDYLTRNNKESALLIGYAENIKINSTLQSVNMNMSSKARTINGELIQSPTVYVIKNNITDTPVIMDKIRQTTTVIDGKTNVEYEVINNEDSTYPLEKNSYPDSGIITAGSPEPETESVQTMEIPRGNIWYGKSLNAALDHIALNLIDYDISQHTVGNTSYQGPANWPRIVLIEDETVTEEITLTAGKSTAAHIYLNNKNLTLDKSISTASNTFLYFYNGTINAGSNNSCPYSTTETSGNSSNLLFSNITFNSENRTKNFLKQEAGTTIITGNSVINGNIDSTGEIAVIGATVNGNISNTEGHIDLVDKITHGDCYYTATSISYVTGNIDLKFKTMDKCSTLNIGKGAKIDGLLKIFNGSSNGGSSSIGFTGTPAATIKTYFDIKPTSELHELYCFKTSGNVAENHSDFFSNDKSKSLAERYLIPTEQTPGNYNNWQCTYKIKQNSEEPTATPQLIVDFVQ